MKHTNCTVMWIWIIYHRYVKIMSFIKVELRWCFLLESRCYCRCYHNSPVTEMWSTCKSSKWNFYSRHCRHIVWKARHDDWIALHNLWLCKAPCYTYIFKEYLIVAYGRTIDIEFILQQNSVYFAFDSYSNRHAIQNKSFSLVKGIC